MKFTVFGAGGFIGRSLASHLRAVGHEVTTPARDDTEVFREPLGHVIYCIGLTADFRSRPFDTVRAHVTKLATILEQCAFSSLLYLSSTRVYGQSSETRETGAISISSELPDLYNLTKLTGESLCLNSGKPKTRVVRLSNVVGPDPGSRNFLPAVIDEALEGCILLRSAPNSSKDYIALEDVVVLLPLIALEGREHLYNIASGRNIENRNIARRIQSITGCSVKISDIAPTLRRAPICIDRLREEFLFVPLDPLGMLPEIVAAHRERSAANFGIRS